MSETLCPVVRNRYKANRDFYHNGHDNDFKTRSQGQRLCSDVQSLNLFDTILLQNGTPFTYTKHNKKGKLVINCYPFGSFYF